MRNRSLSAAAGATVTGRPGSGAGYNRDRVRSGHVETRSLTVTDPYGAYRAGSPSMNSHEFRRLT